MLFSSFVYNTRSCGMGLRTGCVIMLRQRNLSLSFSPRVCSVKNFIPPLRGWLSLPTQAQTPPLRSGKNLGKILQIFPTWEKASGEMSWSSHPSIRSFVCSTFSPQFSLANSHQLRPYFAPRWFQSKSKEGNFFISTFEVKSINKSGIFLTGYESR